MKTIIVSGVSGAGKTQAIDYLEDFGYFCIDNIPVRLLPQFLALCREAGQAKVAVVIDIRSLGFDKNEGVPEDLTKLDKTEEAEVIFLDADDDTLIKRYQQSRRRHPLSWAGSLENAIVAEKKRMKPIREHADHVIDTSDLLPAQLYEILRELYEPTESPDEMQLNILSFGFKNGIPKSADFIFDTRFLPNPYYIEELKKLSGEDKPVRDSVKGLLETVIPSYIKIDKNHLTVAFGCTGGHHRSVTMAYLLAEIFRDAGYAVSLEHRDLKK